MGVQYGANAMSGVLNIITKKSLKNKLQAKVFVQEETVGKEFEFFNQGRHIQSINIASQLTNEDYVSVSYNRNDFKGFLGGFKGKYHAVDDRLRGNEWLPKQQNFAKLLFSHKKKKSSFFYKFDYLHENIYRYDSVVDYNYITQTGTNNPSSSDERFINERFVHHANLVGHLGKVLYNVAVSYQKQEKKRETFTFFIQEDKKENVKEGLFLSKSVWFSRGTFSNLINTKKFKLLAGYEYANEFGFGSSEAVTLALDEDFVTNRLRSFDVFTSSEIIFNENLSVKPGARISFSNLFNRQSYYELSVRQLFKNNWEARGVLGFGARTPNFDELYTYFVDVNHDVRGNEGLLPEIGMSTFFHVKKRSQLSDSFSMKNKVTFSYIDVDDRIELIAINEAPLQLQYNNINRFTSIGTAVENTVYYNNLKLSFGASYFGIKKVFDFETGVLDASQNNFQLNTNFTYTIPKINTSITGYYKYIGKTNRFLQVGGVYENQTINPYSWLDMSVNKKFLDNKINVTFGVRNLLDVVELATNSVSGGAHSGANNTISLGYGRSYFVKLGYSIKM